MLEEFFEKPTRLRQLRRGPFGLYIDGLASELRRAGYAWSSARYILTLAGKFSEFARMSGVLDASQIDTALVRRFLDEELAAEGIFNGAENAMRHVVEHLRRVGVISSTPPAVQTDPFAEILSGYDLFLLNVRGLRQSTRSGYLRGARTFLTWHATHHATDINSLTAPTVLAFVSEQLDKGHCAKSRANLCALTRSFLRYLGSTGIITSGLDRTVPRVPCWRLSSVPRHLPWEQVRALIDSVDTTQPVGLRDKAVLLLLATLGLRSLEIRLLELGHLVWRQGEIRLPRTKSAKERVLPMPQEVGAALADYVLHGRPALDIPHVFLRHRAPHGPLLSSAGVGQIVRYHLRLAGITSPSRGTHMLRHSLATRMVNVGVPIKMIADVLGHESIDTTAIYTKVDITRLAAVAMPFPGGGGG